MNLSEKFLETLECEVRKLLADSPRCHDLDHSFRVLANARHIAQAENADLAVVETAAMLHDIGRSTEFADLGRTCHAEIGAAQVEGVLKKLGITDESFIQHVTDCVATHRYRNRTGENPKTLEAKIIFDADKLDSMGAVGVGRAFHFAGRIGARVHNTEEEALNSESYSREDTAYREYLVKLKNLKDSMLTDEGRRMAEHRHAFMTVFFEELNREME
jgi:uncharacterized protein